MMAAASTLRSRGVQMSTGTGIDIYQKLSQRWVGPVGWMLALWTRLMILGSGIASFFRIGRPFQQMHDAISPRRPKKHANALASDQLDAAQRNYRVGLMRRWPEVAEALLRGRFDPSVRSADSALSSSSRVAEQLTALWNDSVEREIERISGRLGGLWFQIFLNAPAVGILAYMGWVTLRTFFRAEYLGGDYFLHAFWVIAIVLLLSFFALQIVIRLTASSDRILARAFNRLVRDLQKLSTPSGNPLCSQLDRLVRLADAARG
jgi:hypothetical protein